MTASLVAQATRMIGIGFEGASIPDEARNLIARGVGAVIFFSRNVETPEQIAELAALTKSLAPGPLLNCIDQEGGRVVRLREPFTPIPSMAQVGRAGDERLAYQLGVIL